MCIQRYRCVKKDEKFIISGKEEKIEKKSKVDGYFSIVVSIHSIFGLIRLV